MGWTTGVRFSAWAVVGVFSSPPHPDQPWDPPSLLSVGTGEGGLTPGVKLTTHFSLVPRLRMREAMPPLPSTSSWRSRNSPRATCRLYHSKYSRWLGPWNEEHCDFL